MRKNVLGLIMAALAISSFGAFAQNETANSSATCQQTTATCKNTDGECAKNKKDGKKCKKDGKKLKKDGKKGNARMQRMNPFDGIQLTAEQQAKLDALKAERKASKEAAKKASKEARQAERKQFDEKVAKILTPEQYAQYEKNKKAQKVKKAGAKGKVDRMHSKNGARDKAALDKKAAKAETN